MIPVLLEFWWYWQEIYNIKFLYNWKPIHFYIFLPLLFFVMYITMVFTSLFFAKILLVIVNAFHKPREGVFLRDPSDRDYRYWSIRNTIKRWPIWLAHKFPFPFLDNLCFKMFGVKTKFSNSLFEGWVDCEFIEFGKNVVIGQASVIQSACIIGNLLIIKKTMIDDNVRIGAHSVVMPGTHIGKNCILTATSCTSVGQVLEEGWIYLGVPAIKFKKNRFFEDGLEDILLKEKDIEKTREEYEKLYMKKYDKKLTTHKERREHKKEMKREIKRRLEQE